MNAAACPQCVRLRHELDQALEEARQLKALAFGPVDELGRLISRVGLTRSEATIAAVLIHQDVARRDTIMDALYFNDPNGGALTKTVDVLIAKIKRKLAPLGVEILTVYGLGWRMEAESKAKLRAAAGLSA